MRTTRWRIDPVLILENLEGRILTTVASRRGLAPKPLSRIALSQAERLVREHAERFRSPSAARRHDYSLLYKAHASLQLCQRYRSPLQAFAKSFSLKAEPPDGLSGQYDAMELLNACECARAWRESKCGGPLPPEEFRRFAQRRVRADMAKKLRSCGNALLPYPFALIPAASKVLKDDMGFRMDFEKLFILTPAQVVTHLLIKLAEQIERPMERPAQQLGNLSGLTSKTGLPHMPRTGLAIELAEKIFQIERRKSPKSRRTNRQPLRYIVVAAFVAVALGIDYTADAAAKAIKSTIKHNPSLQIVPWERFGESDEPPASL
jgi:hypothetical protein